MTLALPRPKVVTLIDLLRSFSSRKRASRRQLQQLPGKLNWASQVVHGGRTYLRRIFDLMGPLKHSHHKAILSRAFQEDISWWLSFLPYFNGISCLPHSAPTFHCLTDSSSTV